MGAMLVRHQLTSAAIVRREIAADLDDRGFDPECIEDVALVASELVGNAVKHVTLPPDGNVDVTWNIAETHIMLAVSDPSDQPPRIRVATPAETSGRGLAIVESLSAAWGVDRLPTGKRVWAKVPLRRYAG
ncbi:MAG: ATP-binding protein [Actinomycetota bacterium]|nr:ATP-binding protein [Actinomycetota bacterium]